MNVVEVRALTRDDAHRHQSDLEALTAHVGGICAHAPGELIDGSRFQLLRYDTSHAAWHDGRPVGVLLACWRSAEIANANISTGDCLVPSGSYYCDHLAVDPAWRRQGLGRRLMQAWLHRTEQMSESPSRPAAWSLETDSHPDKTHLHAFYAGFGFQVIGTRLFGQQRDFVMWRTADGRPSR